MKKEDLRIIFMGTPEFAVPSLNILIESGYRVSAVVTAPDRKAGRGRKLQPSPVKRFASEHGIKVLQPEKLKDKSFLNELRYLKPDLMIVVAFRMLPEAVWSLPTLGTFNLHASLLPQYRGAAPINYAIINGEKESGLTTFFIDQEIDTGKIIAQKAVSIDDNETFGELHNRMMIKGAQLVAETTASILNDKVKAVEQARLMEDNISLKKAPKLTKDFCRITWSKSCKEVHNFIRGLSPYPGAYSFLIYQDRKPEYYKILRSLKEEKDHLLEPGAIVSDQKTFLKVATQGGFISVMEIQQTGKRSMNVIDFLNGFELLDGMKFE